MTNESLPLKKHRLLHDLTQKQVAEKIGVSKEAVSMGKRCNIPNASEYR